MGGEPGTEIERGTLCYMNATIIEEDKENINCFQRGESETLCEFKKSEAEMDLPNFAQKESTKGVVLGQSSWSFLIYLLNIRNDQLD